MSRTHRAFHAEAPDEGAVVTLDREQSHHVVQVLRLREGDALELFDGQGHAWDGTILAADRAGARIRVAGERLSVVESPYRVTLYQALCRPERMEWVVQKATEVGVHAIRPVRVRRVEGGEPTEDRLERLRRIAREAARQCGRTVVPDISAPDNLPGRPEDGIDAFVLDPAPPTPPLADLLVRPAGRGGSVLIGPEGGLEDAEVTRLEQGGWLRAGLGPRVLRTETAGVVACALLLHAWGDLGARPGASS